MTDTLKFGDSEKLNFTGADVDVSKAFKNDALSSLSSAVNSLTVEESFGYNAQTQSATIQGCTAECVDTSSPAARTFARRIMPQGIPSSPVTLLTFSRK